MGFTYPDGWDIPPIEGVSLTLDNINGIRRGYDGKLRYASLAIPKATEKQITTWLEAVSKETGEEIEQVGDSRWTVGDDIEVDTTGGHTTFDYTPDQGPVFPDNPSDAQTINLPSSWTWAKELELPTDVSIVDAYTKQVNTTLSYVLIAIDEKDMYPFSNWTEKLLLDGWDRFSAGDVNAAVDNDDYIVELLMNTDPTPYQVELTVRSKEKLTSTI
ncbi:hypothetical protein [Propionibacterium freudenreichii]|uniref:hypothetical protein n=1 Tax=Propionibacterium freudenreichii TaxID=1744 RepID=UPI0021A89106|nr:hypothetical protein [Propionibacterium freudenreichii]